MVSEFSVKGIRLIELLPGKLISGHGLLSDVFWQNDFFEYYKGQFRRRSRLARNPDINLKMTENRKPKNETSP